MTIVYVLTIMAGIIFARYWLVKWQSLRAITLAGRETEKLIYKCGDWLNAINNMVGPDESMKTRMKQDIIRMINKAGEDDEYYWKAYYKDFDYNKLWLDPTKWTMTQMYPTLVNLVNSQALMR